MTVGNNGQWMGGVGGVLESQTCLFYFSVDGQSLF